MLSPPGISPWREQLARQQARALSPPGRFLPAKPGAQLQGRVAQSTCVPTVRGEEGPVPS